MYHSSTLGTQPTHIYSNEMLGYETSSLDRTGDPRRYLDTQYYFQKCSPMYQTLPSKRTQYLLKDVYQERSVTPDITRGLDRQYEPNRRDIHIAHKQRVVSPTPQYAHQQFTTDESSLLNLKLGIPVQMPEIRPQNVPSTHSRSPQRPNYPPAMNYSSPYKSYERISNTEESLRISPIDPRNTGTFQSSTPSGKEGQQLKAAANLESILLSPKKSTMSNEELYAVIHKSKKKMNIEEDTSRASPTPRSAEKEMNMVTCKSPETGYVGGKARSRLSWSPTKGKNVDFSTEADKNSPPNDSRSRQSWACNERKVSQQTSRLDFKKLLLQKSSVLSAPPKKISAVEQLKISKQQIQMPKPPPSQAEMSILELSGSPRSFANRKFHRETPTSPKHAPDKSKTPPKLMSPRSQWRFANPRTDVLSSTILEDCREDESPNNSFEKKKAGMKCSQTLNFEEKNVNAARKDDIISQVSKKDTRSPVQDSKPQLAQESEEKNTKGPQLSQDVTTSSTVNRAPKMSISQRIQAQRAKFFSSNNANTLPNYTSQYKNQTDDNKKCSKQPTLETSF